MTCLGCLWVTDIRKKSRGVSLADADNAGPEQVSGVMPVGSHRCQRRLQAHGGQVYTQGPGDAPRDCFAVCIGLRAWRLPRPSFFCTALLTRCRLTPRAPLQLCRKIIPRVLVALRSDAARGKALEVVKTLSSRVKNSTAVVLPVAEIYDVFRSADASPYEKNISLMFLEMGWKRAEPSVQAKLVLSILPDTASHAEQYRTALLQMALSALEHVGSLTSTSWASIRLEGESAKVVRTFLLDVLLFAPPRTAVTTTAPAAGGGASAGPGSSEASSPPPPGMSAVALERIQTKTQQGDGKSIAEYLMLRKVAILKAITSKMLPDVDAFPLAAVASCGAHHDVRRMGEDLLRTLTQANRVDLDAACSVDTVNTLFTLLLGNAEQIKKELQATGKPPAYMGAKPPTAFVASAVDVPTRVVLLAQLCRSVTAANTFPQALQAIFQGIYGADANVRLKQAAMQFAVWTTSNARADVLKPIAPIVLTGRLQ